jgi:hypothetical protein
MNQQEQRAYWRQKQNESRERRRAKKRGIQVPPPAPHRRPMYIAPIPPAVSVNVSCNASIEEIAALGPVRCHAFMNGVASVISLLKP